MSIAIIFMCYDYVRILNQFIEADNIGQNEAYATIDVFCNKGITEWVRYTQQQYCQCNMIDWLIDWFNGTSTQKGQFVPTEGQETGSLGYGWPTRYNA